MRLKSLYLETGDKEMAVTESIILGELYGRAGDEEKKNEMFKVAFDIDHENSRLMGRISASLNLQETCPVCVLRLRSRIMQMTHG